MFFFQFAVQGAQGQPGPPGPPGTAGSIVSGRQFERFPQFFPASEDNCG